MNVRFSKEEKGPWGNGNVRLNLGDGIDRHIHPDNAPLLLRELKEAMGADDDDQKAALVTAVQALMQASKDVVSESPEFTAKQAKLIGMIELARKALRDAGIEDNVTAMSTLAKAEGHQP